MSLKRLKHSVADLPDGELRQPARSWSLLSPASTAPKPLVLLFLVLSPSYEGEYRATTTSLAGGASAHDLGGNRTNEERPGAWKTVPG
jgi:hypothetical protein